MKRTISWVLVLLMLLSLLAGCGNQAEPNNEPQAPTEAVVAPADINLDDAVYYLRSLYKKAAEMTAADFQRVGVIPLGDTKVEVVWSVNVSEDAVKIVKGADGMVTIDVNEESPEEVPYVLTATVTGADGTSESLSWNHVLPASLGDDMGAIVDLAYSLEDGQSLPTDVTLTGVITSIDTPWNPDYKNITVTMQVAGREDKPIQCYRLKGEGAEQLVVGDTITVTGKMKNYKGTIEFDAGGNLDTVEKTGAAIEVPTDPVEILEAAFALKPGQSLPYNATLSGVITAFDGGFSEKYGNVTVTIKVMDKSIVCFRMKGEGANSLHINDMITVTGLIKNYKGTIEFDAGCQLLEVVDGVPPTGSKDPLDHVDAAYKLHPGFALNYPSKLTGTVVSVDSPYSDSYKNVTVTIVVPGREDKPIQCFRMKGEDAAKVGVNDIITVNGWLMNYKGTIEYAASCRLVKWVDAEEPEAPTDPAEIVNAAYELEEGRALPYSATLTGVISKVDTAYSEQYKNVTVTIIVNGMSDKPIMCYRMKGDGADEIGVGDTITVSGIIKNYFGTVEFDAGCKLESWSESEEEEVVLSTPEEIVNAAYELESGFSLPQPYTLTGVISKVNTAYSEQYKNITVTMIVNGMSDKPIVCFRLKGEGAEKIGVGDTITVTGSIMNYGGTIEFNSGCTLDSYKLTDKEPEATEPEATEPEVTEPEETTPVLSTPAEIMDAAYALKSGEELGTFTLSGKISSVDTAYSEQYKNVTVTMTVEGSGKNIQCFRLKGEGADVIAVGDSITVTGKIINYNGKVQFNTGSNLDSFTHKEPEVTEPEATEPEATEPEVTEPEETTPVLSTPAEIMDAAYALESGKSLDGSFTLSGKITNVDTAYSEQYKNVTVTMTVDGSGKSIQCFRLKGTGADQIAIGDTITVTGTIKNYNGKVQFNAGCSLDAYKKAEVQLVPVEIPEGASQADIVNLAYGLENGNKLASACTLTGVITEVNTAYSEQYKNVTVTIVVGGDEAHPIMCYRLKGEGADTIAVGDTISVSGIIKNYKGTIEFDAGCKLLAE